MVRGLEYRVSFSIPCSEETLLSCFILPFTTSVSQVVNNLTYKFSLSIQQLDWILNHISVEQGCPWYQRDMFCSDACKIYGDISFTWCRVIPHYFSHANCNRCNASYEQAVHSGDTGGLDTCNPEVKPLSLPHHLKVSFNKKACKSTSWKDWLYMTTILHWMKYWTVVELHGFKKKKKLKAQIYCNAHQLFENTKVGFDLKSAQRKGAGHTQDTTDLLLLQSVSHFTWSSGSYTFWKYES